MTHDEMVASGLHECASDCQQKPNTRDPVAALLVKVYDDHGFIDYPRMHCDGDDWEPNDPPSQPFFTDHLAAETRKAWAEQGYVLVNAEGLAAAIHTAECDCDYWPGENQKRYRERASAILAAIQEQAGGER